MGSDLSRQALQAIPEALHETVETGWNSLMALEDAGWKDWFQERRDQLVQALARSDFLHEQLVRHPGILVPLRDSGTLDQPWCPGEIRDAWTHQSPHIETEEQLNATLRHFRRRWMFRTVWRDLLNLADFEETAGAMSELADVCIQGAVDWLYADACREWGTPMGRHPQTGEWCAEQLVVLGMGGLGAYEIKL